MKRSFASDNNSGVHPAILQSLSLANSNHAKAYGDDDYSTRAIAKFREHFGSQVEVFFVFNGTGANVLSLKALCRSFEAVICATSAHIQNDECGAPEKITGSKLITVPTPDGKLTPDLVREHLGGSGDQHHVQARLISITQSTELGTIYSLEEIRALSKCAKENSLYLHMDGARVSNAAASLGCTFKEMTTDVGVDVLSFGGTKNGILGGEAVVFLRPELAHDFKFYRKQYMQLASKMRYIAVQFETLLSNDLWKKNADHANKMAQLLVEKISDIPQVKVVQKVQANAVFAQIPAEVIKPLQAQYYFYVWNEKRSEVRWMTSFDTTEDDINGFTQALRTAFSSQNLL